MCGCTAWFVSDLVGNPKDWFFHKTAHILYTQDWLKDEAPEQDGEVFYNTSMPIIILVISHILYSQDWLKDEAPEQDGEVFYNTSMPIIILVISHILYSQDWLKDEAPEQDGEGFYNTSMPVIIFKMIEQNVSTLFYLVSRENLPLRFPTISDTNRAV